MKLAVMSDIHGNLEYLDAVLNDINEQNADKIYICGDLALMGNKPHETLDLLIELSKQKNVVIIRGNCDEIMLKEHKKRAVLKQSHIKFLENLPENHTECNGKLKILAVHGSPRRIDEYVYPEFSEYKLQEIFSGVEEDVVLYGHTHIPHIGEVNGKTIINPGSVGRPHPPNLRPTYAIMDYPDLNTKEFTVMHRFIKLY